MLNYKEALDYIGNIQEKLGSDYSLRDVTELARRVGHPEREIKVIHIAGTNGKGSVGNYISNILAASGYMVGRYVSPTIFDYRERIQKVLGTGRNRIYQNTMSVEKGSTNECIYISEEEAAETITLLKEECEHMVAEGFGQPTAFEIETVMAFLLFRKWKVDAAVVECGLGGRLDATNIIKNPFLCIFTSISLDHMKFLGDSVPQIAREKYGIIKEGTVVVAKKQADCEALLVEICREKHTELIFMEEEKIKQKSFSINETVFVYKDISYTITQGGVFQLENAAIAIEAVRKLFEKGFRRITEEMVKEGLLRSCWKGRFELLSKNPFLLIDGAHNEEAAKKLRLSLETYFPGEKFSFIIGVFQDKEYEKVLQCLLPLAKKVYAVTAPGVRGLSGGVLCECVRRISKQMPVCDCGLMGKALSKALSENKKEKIVVCGSLSILKDVYEYFDFLF